MGAGLNPGRSRPEKLRTSSPPRSNNLPLLPGPGTEDMPLRRPLSIILFALLLPGAGAALAGPPRHPHAPPVPQQRRADDGLSDSVRRIERRTGGQVLSAERVPYDGRNINRIKVVDERGRVRVYMDDPQTPPPPRSPAPPTRGNDD